METNRMRKIVAISLAVLFLVTVTVSAVSAACSHEKTSPKTVSSIKQNNSPIEATASSLPWPLNLPRTHYPGDESP